MGQEGPGQGGSTRRHPESSSNFGKGCPRQQWVPMQHDRDREKISCPVVWRRCSSGFGTATGFAGSHHGGEARGGGKNLPVVVSRRPRVGCRAHRCSDDRHVAVRRGSHGAMILLQGRTAGATARFGLRGQCVGKASNPGPVKTRSARLRSAQDHNGEHFRIEEGHQQQPPACVHLPAGSKSRTITLAMTLPPASLHTLAVALSTRTLFAPTRLLVHTVLGGGQTGRFGGHSGMCATKEAVGRGDVATTHRGINREGCVLRNAREQQREAMPAPAPACDLTCALWFGPMRTHNSSLC